MSSKLSPYFGRTESGIGLRELLKGSRAPLTLIVESPVLNITNLTRTDEQITLSGKDAVMIKAAHADTLRAITYTVNCVLGELSTPVLSLPSRNINEKVLTAAYKAGVRDYAVSSIASFLLMRQLASKLPISSDEEDDRINLGIELPLDAPKSVITALGGMSDVGFVTTSHVLDLMSQPQMFRQLKNTGVPIIIRLPAPPDSKLQVRFAKEIDQMPLSWRGLEESEKSVLESEGIDRTVRDIKQLRGIVDGVAISPGDNVKLTGKVFKQVTASFRNMTLK